MILNKIVIFIIQIYRYFISPLKISCCRFYPSCSAYSIDAFKKYKFHSAIILSISRIIKCHPFHAGGYDPLP